MEYTIENLKATVESTGQTVTGRLIFTQVLVRHQIVHFHRISTEKFLKWLGFLGLSVTNHWKLWMTCLRK